MEAISGGSSVAGTEPDEESDDGQGLPPTSSVSLAVVETSPMDVDSNQNYSWGEWAEWGENEWNGEAYPLQSDAPENADETTCWDDTLVDYVNKDDRYAGDEWADGSWDHTSTVEENPQHPSYPKADEWFDESFTHQACTSTSPYAPESAGPERAAWDEGAAWKESWSEDLNDAPISQGDWGDKDDEWETKEPWPEDAWGDDGWDDSGASKESWPEEAEDLNGAHVSQGESWGDEWWGNDEWGGGEDGWDEWESREYDGPQKKEKEDLKPLYDENGEEDYGVVHMIHPDYVDQCLAMAYPHEVEKLFLDLKRNKTIILKAQHLQKLSYQELEYMVDVAKGNPYFISWNYFMAREQYKRSFTTPYVFGETNVTEELVCFGLWCFVHSLVIPLLDEMDYAEIPADLDGAFAGRYDLMIEIQRAKNHPDFDLFKSWHHATFEVDSDYRWGDGEGDPLDDFAAYVEWLVLNEHACWESSETEKVLRQPTLVLGETTYEENKDEVGSEGPPKD